MDTALTINPDLTCPDCGWTAARLRDTGRMGCATCYDTFESMVSRAVEELHGVPAAAAPLPVASPIPLPPDRAPRAGGINLLQWPTRRATKPAAPRK